MQILPNIGHLRDLPGAGFKSSDFSDLNVGKYGVQGKQRYKGLCCLKHRLLIVQ